LIKFLLLTGAREKETRAMTRQELNGADWLLPAARNKTKVDLLRPLSAGAQDILKTLPSHGNFVFSGNGTMIGGLQWRKARFDKLCGVTGWVLHDLRRTARSLMSRAGVNADHAERCLRHVIGGVRGVYDRHEYYHEKHHAFEALAAQIGRIVNPVENVLPMRG
jgi:integrase